MSRLPIIGPDVGASPGTGVPGWLSDRQGRHLRYLRLSVTDRCDLRCKYCMPPEGISASPKSELLSFEEIVRVARIFKALGVRTIRLTGGEPLVRRGLPDLVARLKDEAGIEDLALTTNASILAKHAPALMKAGLRRINVSLDSLNPERFAEMTRGGDLVRVLGGIEAAKDAGIPELKTNSVVVRGHNDTELPEIVEWAWARGVTPRFIELMPLGEAHRLGPDAVFGVSEMRKRLVDLLDPAPAEPRLDRGPASYARARDGSGNKVGFITAVTESFCDRCNRVRVTAKGDIRACLASPEGLSLRDLLRSGADDEEAVASVEAALFGKRDGHEFTLAGVTRHHGVHMSRVGG